MGGLFFVTVKWGQVNRSVKLSPVFVSGTVQSTVMRTALSSVSSDPPTSSGTSTTMRVGSQIIPNGGTGLPSNVTLPLVSPKLIPLIVTAVLTGPETGERLGTK